MSATQANGIGYNGLQMRLIACPMLGPPVVELTDERERHIEERHPDLLPKHWAELEETILDPDHVIANEYNPDKLAFVKWFPKINGGKFVIAQVIAEPGRFWIVTAYLDSVSPS